MEREAKVRPRGVTLIVVLGMLQALLFSALGVALILARDQEEVVADVGGTPREAVVVGAVVLSLGLGFGLLAVFLWRGREWARSSLGVVNTVEVAVAVYALVAQRDLRLGSLWALALPVGVLYLLYASDRTKAFFSI